MLTEIPSCYPNFSGPKVVQINKIFDLQLIFAFFQNVSKINHHSKERRSPSNVKVIQTNEIFYLELIFAFHQSVSIINDHKNERDR